MLEKLKRLVFWESSHLAIFTDQHYSLLRGWANKERDDAPFFYMIDINLLRPEKGGDIEKVKASQRKRGGEKAVELVDKVIALDKEWVAGN